MASLNKVQLIGNLGSDPEIRTLQSGTKVATFSIATTESYINKNNEKVKNTTWHKIEVWDKLADVVQKYLKKGNPVYVEGKLLIEEYEDKNGVKNRTAKIRVSELQMLGNANPSSNLSPTENSEGKVVLPPAPPAAGQDDDLPF